MLNDLRMTPFFALFPFSWLFFIPLFHSPSLSYPCANFTATRKSYLLRPPNCNFASLTLQFTLSLYFTYRFFLTRNPQLHIIPIFHYSSSNYAPSSNKCFVRFYLNCIYWEPSPRQFFKNCRS